MKKEIGKEHKIKYLGEEYPVKYMHLREYTEDGITISKGGTTIAFIDLGNEIISAQAECSPLDNYSKKFGRDRARGRLIGKIKKMNTKRW